MTNSSSNASSSDSSQTFISRLLQISLRTLRRPFFWGIVLVSLGLGVVHHYDRLRSIHESARPESLLFSLIDGLELRYSDFRFQVRGPQATQAPVALIGIDDSSISRIGRWPWSRDVMARLLKNLLDLDVRAIGLDVIFAEPERATAFELAKKWSSQKSIPSELRTEMQSILARGTPDQSLAEVLRNHSDRIVLGVFSEEAQTTSRPYQDYCRNEAFKRGQANQFVKLNASFIVEDASDPFVDLDWAEIFEPLFSALESSHKAQILLQVFQGRSQESLKESELSLFHKYLYRENMRFCDQWLTEEDPFREDWDRQAEILKASGELASLPSETRFQTFKSLVKVHPIAHRRDWTINIPLFQEASQFSGSFSADLDPDGKIRRTSLFNRTGNRLGLSFVPSISLQTFLVGSGLRAEITLDTDPANPKQKRISRAVLIDPDVDPDTGNPVVGNLPLDLGGRMRVNYLGGTQSVPTIPAADLLNDLEDLTVIQRVQNESGEWSVREWKEKKKDFLKFRSVIIGATAVGVYDLRNTPFEKNFPGPEIHTSFMANLFDRDFIKSFANERLALFLLVGLGGLIFAYWISISGATYGLLSLLLITFILFWVDQFLFRQKIVFNFVLPIAFFWLLYISLTFLKYFIEERKKRELKSTFAKYVAPAVVEEILKSPKNVDLGGRKQNVSVFFSDVRGFTSISETLDPQMLTEVLNEYLTPMTEIVFRNKGTLDKYIGDAVMAFFGAPIASADHAYQACLCAIESLEKLKDIQASFQARGLPLIDIGIGINTSDVFVGNMGSKIVRNFTVMGDGVNLASRLEGTTKEYGCRILIAESTWRALNGRLVTREVDLVRVKGKSQPIRIFEVMDRNLNPELEKRLQLYRIAYETYRARRFNEALTLFQDAESIGWTDPVSQIYVARCQKFLSEPPPEEWDGVFVMKNK